MATRPHYIDHIVPIWKNIRDERKGLFFTIPELEKYAEGEGIDRRLLRLLPKDKPYPWGTNPILVCSTSDCQAAYKASPQRKLIMMEHGVGITMPHHPSYAGGRGIRRKVWHFLAPNNYIFEKTKEALPAIPQTVIGTPKVDRYRDFVTPKNDPPIVVISFHWDGSSIHPMAGNAFLYYKDILKEVASQDDFKLMAHGHPRQAKEFKDFFNSIGVAYLDHFSQVIRHANLYVNDCSSTLFEFAITGRPVVILNEPRFSKVIHTGIRFWDYADIGLWVNQPEMLLLTIRQALNYPTGHRNEVKKMVEDLYPYLGGSASFAADTIELITDPDAQEIPAWPTLQ